MGIVGWIALGGLMALIVFKVRGAYRSPEQVAAMRALVNGGGALVDVRSPPEFSSGHLEGAINLPLANLNHRCDEIGAKERNVVVYCLSGARSRSAAGVLAQHGFSAVHDLGAMTNWSK